MNNWKCKIVSREFVRNYGILNFVVRNVSDSFEVNGIEILLSLWELLIIRNGNLGFLY